MNLERFKVWTIVPREPLKLLMFLAGTVTLCCIAFAAYQGALWLTEARHETAARWKQVETATGLLETHMPAWVQSIDKTLSNLESTSRNANDATADIKDRTPEIISSFTGVGKEGAGLIADIRRDNPATSARQLIDEAKPNIVGASEQLKTGMTSLADAARVIDESIKDPKVKTFVDEAMARGKSILINLDTATRDVTFITADGRKVTTHAIGISANFEAMTADSKLKLHQVLFPEKAKGFWPRTGQILRYIWEPVSEGLGVYYRLRTLPIRITEPIPLLR